jgi:hypothetical protein
MNVNSNSKKTRLTKFLRQFVALMMLMALSTSAMAATVTAVASGNWSNASTWSGGTLPNSGDDVVIPAGLTVVVNQFALASHPYIEVAGTLELVGGIFPLYGLGNVLNIGGNAGFLVTPTGTIHLNLDGVNISGGNDGIIGVDNNATLTFYFQPGGKMTTRTNYGLTFYNATTNTPDQYNNSNYRLPNTFPITTSFAVTGSAEPDGGVSFNTTAVVAPVPTDVLPVTLSGLNAKIRAGLLHVNWQTESEANNKHFIVQASVNGDNWMDLGQVNSKAPNGKSDARLDYSFSQQMGQVALAGFGLLGLLLLPAARNRAMKILIAVLVIVGIASCAKNDAGLDEFEENEKGQATYIRIVQVDLDGKTTYSPTILAKRI